jgi:hypothetical protein
VQSLTFSSPDKEQPLLLAGMSNLSAFICSIILEVNEPVLQDDPGNKWLFILITRFLALALFIVLMAFLSSACSLWSAI